MGRTAELLATDLPRYHPSFRFEEQLAARLAAAAAAGAQERLATDGALIPFPPPAIADGVDRPGVVARSGPARPVRHRVRADFGGAVDRRGGLRRLAT